ncbi:MAG: DUF87 domain-containing protein [Oligoflexia bacterium]|nr:DUF87 domain-containing protein [Oligoflexia bacterium]
MIYRVQFLEKKVSAEQWTTILDTLRRGLKTFRLFIHVHGDKFNVYLSCTRSPHGLNASIFPLHIDRPCQMPFPERSATALTFLTGDIMEQVLKVSTKAKNAEQAQLWISVTSGTLARLFPGMRKLRLMVPSAWGWVKKISLTPISIPHFLAFDLSKSPQYNMEVVKPKLKTNIEYELPLDNIGGLALQSAPNSFLNLSKIDHGRHSLIVGQSGSGKSELLKLVSQELYARGVVKKQGLVIIDPHGKLYEQLSPLVPCYNLDPQKQHIQFFEGNLNPLASSELSLDLIESQLSKETPLDIRGKRVLRFVLFALFAGNVMSYENIARFMNDVEFRMNILARIESDVVRDFFNTEYPELRSRYYDSAILPILNIVGEYQLSISNGERVSFLEVFRNNRIIVVSIPQGQMGSKLTKLYGATVIQQLFLYSQSGLLNCPFLVMIDELPLVYTNAFNQILAESRKFGLALWVVQQYLSQLPQAGLSSIFANMSNYFCFKTNIDDAQMLAENLNLEIESFSENRLNRSHKELASSTLVDQSRGDLVARLMVDGRYIPAVRLQTDIHAWNKVSQNRKRAYA